MMDAEEVALRINRYAEDGVELTGYCRTLMKDAAITIRRLRSERDEARKELKAARNEIARLNGQSCSPCAACEAKDAEIAKLKTFIACLRGDVDEVKDLLTK